MIMYNVCYEILENGLQVNKIIDSPYLLKKFLCKIKFSKRVKLIDLQRIF